MAKEWVKLSHRRARRYSLARRNMINWMKPKKKASTLQKSYFTLFESLLAPRSNPLLAVEELYFAKKDSMDFHAHVMKIAKRCKFPNPAAEERAVRDTVFLGMNSTLARDKAINLINEEGKKLTMQFLIQQLEIEDCNAQHNSLSQLDSTTSVNFAAYDCRQNRCKSNKSKQNGGKNQGQNNSGARII